LERPDVDNILRQVGVTNYWLRSAILIQAGGRPGWAVVLAKAAAQSMPRDLLAGSALARQVERSLHTTGDSDRKLRILSHIALYDGVAERQLGHFARRIVMPLPEVTNIMHATTHNGLLERANGTWHVQP
jgi:hypothetical protein